MDLCLGSRGVQITSLLGEKDDFHSESLEVLLTMSLKISMLLVLPKDRAFSGNTIVVEGDVIFAGVYEGLSHRLID